MWESSRTCTFSTYTGKSNKLPITSLNHNDVNYLLTNNHRNLRKKTNRECTAYYYMVIVTFKKSIWKRIPWITLQWKYSLPISWNIKNTLQKLHINMCLHHNFQQFKTNSLLMYLTSLRITIKKLNLDLNAIYWKIIEIRKNM